MAMVFFTNGAVFANWVARVPAVKDATGAGTGSLGLALLAMAAGSLVSMSFAGRLCERFGSSKVVTVCGLALAVALLDVALAPNVVVLGLMLSIYGASFGLLDVAMNVQAVGVVRRIGRPIMPWFHAAFSIGGLTGAAAGGLAAAGQMTPAWHFALVGVAVIGAMLAVRPSLLADDEPGGDDVVDSGGPPRLRRASLLVLGLGAIAGCSALVEGAMADWTALFLRDVRDLAEGAAALGFAAFSITMTVGRLGGEAAIRHVGPVRVLRAGGLTAAVGVLVAVLVPAPAAGVAGFGLVGLGVSCVFPLALGAAGDAGNGSGSSEIATVSMVGYLGFLLGPPLIGLLAEVVELQGAMLAVAVPALGLVALAPVLLEPSDGTSRRVLGRDGGPDEATAGRHDVGVGVDRH